MIMNDRAMDVRRLRLLVELSRLGSMRAVAEETGVTIVMIAMRWNGDCFFRFD